MFICAAINAPAQQSKVTYQPLVQAGLLEGERGSAVQLQSVQGVRYKTWSAGVGAGLDYYHTRSIPLFLDVRKRFGKKEGSAFVYADGGYNFPWLTTTDKLSFNHSKGGLYYDAGIGYELAAKKKSRLFFSAGYTLKKFETMYDYIICPSIAPCVTQTNSYAYSLRRLSIKAGLSF